MIPRALYELLGYWPLGIFLCQVRKWSDIWFIKYKNILIPETILYNMFLLNIPSYILPLMSLAAHAPSYICVLLVLTGKGIQQKKSWQFLCFQILCNCEGAPSLSGIVSTFNSSLVKYSTLLLESQNILENYCDDTFGLDNWNQHWVCLSVLWNLHHRICWRYSLGQSKKMWVWGKRSIHDD